MSDVNVTGRSPVLHELEAYKQMHETRRKWEGYIWQYGILVTALIALVASRLDSTTTTATLFGETPEPLAKMLLALLALFLGSMFLNVYRARSLMKRSEKTIQKMHGDWGISYAIVPLELDAQQPPRLRGISSTLVAAVCHFLLFLFAFLVAIGVWIDWP